MFFEDFSFDIDGLGERTNSGVLPFFVSIYRFQSLSIFAKTMAFAASDDTGVVSPAVTSLPASGLLLLSACGVFDALRHRGA